MHFETGLIVYLFGSVTDERYPEDGKTVRAELLSGGYALEPADGGTRVIYVSQRDLKGKISSWVLSKVALAQGQVPKKLAKAMAESGKAEAPSEGEQAEKQA